MPAKEYRIVGAILLRLSKKGPAILGPRIPSWQDLNKLLSGSLLGEIQSGYSNPTALTVDDSKMLQDW